MKKTTIETVVTFAIGIVTVALAVGLNLPHWSSKLAFQLGASTDSLLDRFFVGVLAPAVLTLLAWLPLILYEKVIWRIVPALGCKSGWWVYGLSAAGDNGYRKDVVGIFLLRHTTKDVIISEGCTYDASSDICQQFGTWKSETINLSADSLRFVFDFRWVIPTPENRPEIYEGFLSLQRTTASPESGKDRWEGYFNDLGQWRNVRGGVYAERLRGSSNRTEAEAAMWSLRKVLAERARCRPPLVLAHDSHSAASEDRTM